MGSIGPGPSEIVLQALIYYLFIGAVGGWILYQFRIMRRLFAIGVYLFSCLLVTFLFFQSSKNVTCYALFMPSIAYGFSAYYLARRGLFTRFINGINLVYLAMATYFILQITFTVNYESAVLVTLMDLVVCIASYLLAPISMLVLLVAFKKRGNVKPDDYL